jgi:peroxiredoxin
MSSTALAALRDEFARCLDMDASLEERLDAYSRAIREYIPDYGRAADDLVGRLRRNNAGITAPKPGEPMPPFTLPDESGRLVSLEALLRDGPVAITFNRGHWCPWCRISAKMLGQIQDELTQARGQLVAIVPERQKFAAEFRALSKFPFPVLSDMENGYGLSLNLAIWIGPELERLLRSYGIVLPDYQGNNSWILPIPATFVVATNGYVTARFVDPDFRHRMAVEDLLRAVQSAR